MQPTRDHYLDPEIDKSLTILCDHVAGVAGRERFTRDRLRDLAQRSFEHGRAAAIHELLTTQQMAAILGITDSHVRRLAGQHDIGWLIGRDRLYRPEDVARFPPRQRKAPPIGSLR